MADDRKQHLPVEQLRHVVYCEGGGVPTVVHPTWGTAMGEAKRLSKLHPGHRFHVMQTRRIFWKPEGGAE